MLFSSQSLQAQNAPTQRDIAGYGGLHQAAHLGETQRVLELVKAGAQLEATDDSGRTPAIVAAFASNERMVQVLANAGADMNALEYQSYDILTIAAVANDLRLLQLALDSGASAQNITSPYNGTALIAAAHLGHHQVVGQLIANEAPLDHINNLHWTALIEAVVLGDGGPNHTLTVKLLLDAGADQSIGDSKGVTALQHAKSRGFERMVKLLLDHQQ